MTNGGRRGFGLLRSMVNRDPGEERRSASPLELFFDLCFVVAIAQASSGLHHTLDEGHLAEGVVGFVLVFFAIWWAWVTFTWFASSYDNDDPLYRVAVFVQIAGVLVLAAGTPRAFASDDFAVVALGYVIMRCSLVSLWLRAARDDPSHRRTALRYAGGISLLQLCWIAMVFVPTSWTVPAFALVALAEMTVPVLAERGAPLGWHPSHVAERYGLFTIIVLGETVLSESTAIQEALDAGRALDDLLVVALAALMIVCSMWWIYFDHPTEEMMSEHRRDFARGALHPSFIWGYGHYFVFAGAAAVGAGIAVVIDYELQDADISARSAALTVAVPAAIYILAVWAIHRVGGARRRLGWAYPVTAGCVVIAAGLGLPMMATGVLLALLTTTTLGDSWQEGPDEVAVDT